MITIFFRKLNLILSLFRFMADALYIMMLRITCNVSKLMSSEESKMIETAALFISIFYSVWFLKSYMASQAPNNDLMCFKQVFTLKDHYPKLGGALLISLQRHTWYLTEELVVLSLADADLEKDVKQEMLIKLLNVLAPETYAFEKPVLPTILSSTKLPDLIGPKSWFLLQVAKVDRTDIQAWAVNGMVDQSFVTWVKQLTVVNDASERNVRLVQDFCDSYKSEAQRQNNFQVVKSHRKKLKTDYSLCDLEALTKE